jgi:hypothetical protein
MLEQLMISRPGRPPIGPKAQANIPQHEYDWILREAAKRKITYADMMRAVVTAGVQILQVEG